MKVLVACEFSGIVREAFRRLGHDAWSSDLLPSEDSSAYHYRGDVRNILHNNFPLQLGLHHRLPENWDLMIAHPPCTRLAVSGARWFKGREREQNEALDFVRTLMDAPIRRIALENPVSVISTRIRPPDQIIQPWQFGHGETKATCLWLKNLPKLKPTNIIEGRKPRVFYESPGKDRWKRRSRTYLGIAEAMAAQWGCLSPSPPT